MSCQRRRRSVQLPCTPGCHRNTNSNKQRFPYQELKCASIRDLCDAIKCTCIIWYVHNIMACIALAQCIQFSYIHSTVQLWIAMPINGEGLLQEKQYCLRTLHAYFRTTLSQALDRRSSSKSNLTACLPLHEFFLVAISVLLRTILVWSLHASLQSTCNRDRKLFVSKCDVTDSCSNVEVRRWYVINLYFDGMVVIRSFAAFGGSYAPVKSCIEGRMYSWTACILRCNNT